MFRHTSHQEEFILGFCIFSTYERDFNSLCKDSNGLILRLAEELKEGDRFYHIDSKLQSGPFDFKIYIEVPRSNLKAEKKEVIKLKSPVQPGQIQKITYHIGSKEKTINNPDYFSFESSHVQEDIVKLTTRGIPLKKL